MLKQHFIKKIESFFSESPLLSVMLFIMGGLIVTFNVKGYEVLFYDTPLIPFLPVSPFGVLLGFAELAVLVWTSAVISNWNGSSRILKLAIWLLVPAFSFLSYSGINSYLGSLASSDIQKVREVKLRTSNNIDVLEYLQKEKALQVSTITRLSEEQENLNNQINSKNNQINKLLKEASDRRLTAADCSVVTDCANAVSGLNDQAVSLKLDVTSLNRTRKRNDVKITRAEDKLDVISGDISSQKLSERDAKNSVANTESSYELKKANYERIILNLAGIFNIKPEDPFGIFVSLLSFLIYPVYFILNLYTGLNSKSNIEIREQRVLRKKERASVRNLLLKSISRYLKSFALRKKMTAIKNLKDSSKQRRERKSNRERYYKKMICYFKVWAHRRKKTMNIEIKEIVEKEVVVEKEIEKIVEKEIEVEKVIEKIVEVEVEVRIEVPVYVDKIVKVLTEVPIYVEKVKKVPEPVFIKEPQIIIHERLVPVPADVTAQELEMIFNAQPRLNTTARDAESTVLVGSDKEGFSERESTTQEGETGKERDAGQAA